ncbi:MAG: acetyl-CoA carboxylase biotin carboxyl carrier protein [Oscillospiraceae bacterium]
MEIKEIKELMAEFNSSDITFLEIEQNQTRIKLKKECPALRNENEGTLNESAFPKALPQSPASQANKLLTITAPLVGVFYSSPSPDAPTFVKAGSAIKKGDVVGLIEAMKMISEIKSTCDGIIKNVQVKNEQIVEFGQVLMEIEE